MNIEDGPLRWVVAGLLPSWNNKALPEALPSLGLTSKADARTNHTDSCNGASRLAHSKPSGPEEQRRPRSLPAESARRNHGERHHRGMIRA